MPMKIHPADVADRAKIASATHFNVHVRQGPSSKINREAPSLIEAISVADTLRAEFGKPPMIYAITPEGGSIFIPDAIVEEARQGSRAADPDAKPAKAERPAGGKRAAILEAAQRGELPAAPDFSAETHKRFRPRLAAVMALVAEGNIAALKAIEIKPISTSPKAIARYRDLAVTALEARALIGSGKAVR